MTGPVTAPPAELRDRMGRYIAAELPRREVVRRIGWPVSVIWGERSVGATLTRGELVLKAEISRLRWWEPPRRSRAAEWIDRLGGLLMAYHKLYASVDETGRMHITAWRGHGDLLTLEHRAGYDAVLLRMEPGVRTGATNGGGLGRLYRIGEDISLTVPEAFAAGWVAEANGPCAK